MEFELDVFIPPIPEVNRGFPVVLGADPKGIYLLYGNRNNVILRNLKDFCKNDIFTRHSKTVKAAKYSPDGFYIASSDKGGCVLIWDTVNPEHIVKNEYNIFSGPINDIAWTSDKRRFIVGGLGQSVRAKVLNTETGSSVSELDGISTEVNSVDIRPTAPPRAIAGDSEGLVSFYDGNTYKFKSHTGRHTSFVNVVRFSPTGAFFVSAGSDGKISVYDADTGFLIGDAGNPAHSGSIYAISFCSNGSRFVSSSADKSLKLWAVDGKEVKFLASYQFPGTIDHMVNGCCWVSNTIAAVTLDGSIHLFDASEHMTQFDLPRAVLSGHTGAVTCALYSADLDRLLTCSFDSSIASWNLTTGFATRFTAPDHKNGVVTMAMIDETLVTVGLDDRCLLSNLKNNVLVSSFRLPSQPHSVGIMPLRKQIIVGCDQHIVLLSAVNDSLIMLDQQAIASNKNVVAVSPQTGLAIVCCKDGQCMVFKVCNGQLIKTHLANLSEQRPITAAFSPDGSMIALGNMNRSVSVFTVIDEDDPQHQPVLQSACSSLWQKHSASLTAISWSPNGKRIATAGLDTMLVVWSLQSPKNTLVLKNAHPKNHCVSICWINDSKLCGVAPDGSIRCWTVQDQ